MRVCAGMCVNSTCRVYTSCRLCRCRVGRVGHIPTVIALPAPLPPQLLPATYRRVQTKAEVMCRLLYSTLRYYCHIGQWPFCNPPSACSTLLYSALLSFTLSPPPSPSPPLHLSYSLSLGHPHPVAKQSILR